MIREIRQFQQTPYKIEFVPKVANYILDTTRIVEEDRLYFMSLQLEPRQNRLSSSVGHSAATAAVASKHDPGH